MNRLLVKTFPRGGGAIPHRKYATESKNIVVMDAPQRVIIPLRQHIGAECEPLVKVGDSVKIGQKIGESSQYISAPVHASVSGVVVEIKEYPLLDGNKSLAIVIENDGLDHFWQTSDSNNYNKPDSKKLAEIIKDAGIVGMGGAGFPTHVKVMPNQPIDAIIINGAECEPYLTCDHRLMVERGEDLLKGLQAVMAAVKAPKGVIGIEDNKADAIEVLQNLLPADSNIEVVPLKVKYPQGAEKQLIKAVNNREVPSGSLPASVGCIVFNVHTIIAIAEALNDGLSSYQRVITVSGNNITNPQNLLVRIGTPIKEVLEFCGGISGKPGAIVAGGPMTGKAILELAAPVVKNLSGILVLGPEEITQTENNPCIRCAKCVDACPMGLQPNFIAELSDKGLIDRAERLDAMDCIECGLCSFVCPALRSVCNSIQNGKNAIRAKKSAG